nr:MAG TPA: hypothetical protein [Caudoviricetes sp.]
MVFFLFIFSIVKQVNILSLWLILPIQDVRLSETHEISFLLLPA